MDNNLTKQFDKNNSLNDSIFINLKLNEEEERLDELYQTIEIQNIREGQYNLCKTCMCYNTIDFDNSLCEKCNKIQTNKRISNSILISGWFSSSMILGIGFSLNIFVFVTVGLSIGNIFKNIYDLIKFSI
jgi:hypothetical protein